MTILRRVGLRGTDLAKARIDTIRSRLLKLAGCIRVTVCKVLLSFASVFSLQGVFKQALANLRAASANLRTASATLCAVPVLAPPR